MISGAAALDEEYVSMYFLATSNEYFFLVAFRIWRSTGSFRRTISFRVHKLRLNRDAYTRKLTDSS